MGDLAESRCVEAVGRLVQNEQPWGPNQAGGESYAAPLAKRQTPETLVGKRRKPKRPDLFGVEATKAFERLDHGQPLRRAQVFREIRVLRCIPDVGKRCDAGCSQRKTCDPYFAGVRDRDAD